MEEKVEFPEPPFDRQKVRALVEAQGEALVRASKERRNPHQLSLDQADMREKRLAELPDDDVQRFEKLYEEESQAWSAGMDHEIQLVNLEADRLEAETAQTLAELAGKEADAQLTGALIAVGVLGAALILILSFLVG